MCNVGGYWYIILTLSHTHIRTCPPDWSCSLLLFADNTSVRCFSLSLWVPPTLPLRKCVISPSNESSTFYLHPHGLFRWRDGRFFQLMLHPGYRYARLITPTTPPSRRVFLLSSFFLSVRACKLWPAPMFRYMSTYHTPRVAEFIMSMAEMLILHRTQPLCRLFELKMFKPSNDDDKNNNKIKLVIQLQFVARWPLQVTSNVTMFRAVQLIITWIFPDGCQHVTVGFLFCQMWILSHVYCHHGVYSMETRGSNFSKR